MKEYLAETGSRAPYKAPSDIGTAAQFYVDMSPQNEEERRALIRWCEEGLR